MVGARPAVAARAVVRGVAGGDWQPGGRQRVAANAGQAATSAPSAPSTRQVRASVTVAYVALGSNLDDPRRQVLDALEALAHLPGTHVLQRSFLYRTPPWGVLDQPPFVNAAAELDTSLTPHALLDALLAIEQRAGRVRGVVNGPRTLDLDLLHVAGVQCHDGRLTLPHPRMRERAFVLLPLNDIAPSLLLAGTLTVAQQLARLDLAGCERIM